jgi:hypothetical protein
MSLRGWVAMGRHLYSLSTRKCGMADSRKSI